ERVRMRNGPSENQVGGNSASVRNVISGNTAHGVELISAPNNLVQGNYIGTDITGQLDRDNSVDGVAIISTEGNLVGGTFGVNPSSGCVGECNLISGNN